MRNIKDESLKISKNKKNNTRPKTKSFGYQILGMGGGTVVPPFSFDYMVVGGGAGGGELEVVEAAVAAELEVIELLVMDLHLLEDLL